MIGFAFVLPFDFEQPQWLLLVLLIPLLVFTALRSLAGLEAIRRTLTIVVRSALILILACCLAGVQRVQRNDELTVMFLLDRSFSTQALQIEAENFIKDAASKARDKERVGMIDFARQSHLQQLPMKGGYFREVGRLSARTDTDRTDVSAAIRLAMAMFPHDTAKRIVLLSDGNDNMGDVLSEIRRAGADGISIDVVPLHFDHPNEVFVERVIAPTHAEVGEQVPVRINLGTHKPAKGSISIVHNGQLLELSPEDARVDLPPGDSSLLVRLPIRSAGTQIYEVRFRPDNESMDAIALNNSASAFSFVSGSSPALLITHDPAHDQALYEALVSENVQVEMKTDAELGNFSLLQMLNYSTIILSNIPAASFTDEQQAQLTSYVKDTGSGLIMLGGDEGYGAGGWIGSPVEEVMPISFEIKHKRVIPRGALVLIMHSCEIPRGEYWGKEMAKKSVDTVSTQDYVGVLAYSYSPGGENWEVPLDLNSNRAAVKAKIDRMQNGDMPDFGTSMQMAYKELTGGKGRDAAQKHVIILSDGDAQAPSQTLLNDYKKSKITVSTIGIGWGGHVIENVLADVARQTGGQYYAAKNPKQLPQIFVKESKTVRRPLLIDEPFRPQIASAHSDLLGGLTAADQALPTLGGMVLTTVKPNPNVLMPIVRVTDDGNDPVLAHWQYELGKTVAFTSGYWPVWGRDWTKWQRFAKFWAQIVRWTMRQDSPANFDSQLRIEGNRGRAIIDALDKDANYLNNLELHARILGPNNRVIPVDFVQTGPGHYEADFDAEQAGQYLANVQIEHDGQRLGTLRTGVSLPFSPEYRDLGPNEALLRQITDETGGRVWQGSGNDADVFRRDQKPTTSKRSAWEWAFTWLFLPLFLLDVAVRRLASWLALSVAVEVLVLVVLLFGLDFRSGGVWSVAGAIVIAELVGWAIRFRSIGAIFDWMTHSVAVLAQAGDRSAVSLEKLRTLRDHVRDDLTAEPPERTERPRPSDESDEPIPLASPSARFDVDDKELSAARGDVQEALGGAKAADSSPSFTKKPERSGAEEEGMTSRLLKAKRRARKDPNGAEH